jgi:VWFA-related protein
MFSLAAATALADHREVTTVEVVQVPVYVTRDGASVTGLTRNNFELFVNGKPQAIDYFDAVDFAAPPPVSSRRPEAEAAPLPKAPADARQRRLYVLLFDGVYSTLKGLSRAQVAADRYIEESGPNDFFAVATYTSAHGVQLLVPFTRDQVALHHAVQRFAQASNGDPLRLSLSIPDVAETVTPDRFAESSDLDVTHEAAKELVADAKRTRIADQIDSLGELADRLATIEGYKHVVLLTGGFDTGLMHGAGAANTMDFPDSFSATGQVNRPVRKGWTAGRPDAGIVNAMRRMYSRFTGAGVFLDAIDIEGNRFSFSSSHQSESLSTYARDTGGEVILNHNDLRQAMQQLTSLQRVVYVLAFHAKETGRKENAITVKLRDAGSAHVTYRPSYSTTLPRPSPTDGLRLADILENDIPQTGMSATLSVTQKTVDVTVPPGELVALAGQGVTAGEALIYIFSGRHVAAFSNEHLTIDPARADLSRPLHLTHTFDLPPGHYVAKVLLRVDGSDALGFARNDFTIGD